MWDEFTDVIDLVALFMSQCGRRHRALTQQWFFSVPDIQHGDKQPAFSSCVETHWLTNTAPPSPDHTCSLSSEQTSTLLRHLKMINVLEKHLLPPPPKSPSRFSEAQ